MLEESIKKTLGQFNGFRSSLRSGIQFDYCLVGVVWSGLVLLQDLGSDSNYGIGLSERLGTPLVARRYAGFDHECNID